jgi:hypothetical protein
MSIHRCAFGWMSQDEKRVFLDSIKLRFGHGVQMNLEIYDIDNACLSMDNKKNILDGFCKWFTGDDLHKITDKKRKYYNPIIERNFGHIQNRHCIYSIVPDSVFFSFPDRALALERIDDFNKKYFTDMNYINWSDSYLVEFMAKRISDRK